jgi:hypothetical protein
MKNADSQKKLVIGGSIFLFGQLSPLLFIPLISASSLSTEWKTVLSGLFMFGIPPLFTMSAIIILGKEGFKTLQGQMFGLLRRYALPQAVSRSRYRLGLLLFVLPLLFGWLSPYLSLLLDISII